MNTVDEILAIKRKLAEISSRLSDVRAFSIANIDDEISFLDNFGDGDLFWTWKTHNIAAGKTITEAGGKLTIAVTEGTRADWSNVANFAPKVYMGIPGLIFEASCKIDAGIWNTNTAVRIQVSDYSESFASPDYFSCERRFDGLRARLQPTSVSDIVAEFTLPIYLKIRYTGAHNYNYFQGYYSTNGINWTSFKVGAADYVVNNYNCGARGWAVGLHVENWLDGAVYHAVLGEYDYFKVTRPRGPR